MYERGGRKEERSKVVGSGHKKNDNKKEEKERVDGYNNKTRK